MAQKPTIVFVPGAWHTSEGFATVLKHLNKAGFDTKEINNPSTTADGPYATGIGEDVENIRDIILPIIDGGRDVVLVMHSYGGIPGSSAVKGLSKEERTKEGKEGGVSMLIFMTAMVANEGVNLVDTIGGSFPPWIKVQEDGGYVTAEDSGHIFYNDMTTDEASKWTAKLQKHSLAAMRAPCTYAGWKHIPSAYLLCSEDNAIPIQAQEAMSQFEGGKWVYQQTLQTSHSPFLSAPSATADAIGHAIEKI